MHYYCSNKFSEFTILNIAISLITIIKEMNKKVILHKDLKPGNICYGFFQKIHLLNQNIIDFGLAWFIVSKKEKTYLPK